MLRALILGVCLTAPLAAQTGSVRSGSPEHSPPGKNAVLLPAKTTTPAPKPEFQEVEIKVERNLVLKGSWFAPTRKGRNVPGVLLIHDAGSDRSKFEGLAEKIQKQGFGVLTVDLRGHGGSKTKDLDWTKLDEKSRKTMWLQALKDVKAASDWLLDQKKIHSTKLCMVGHGSGAALVAYHMSTDDNAKAVVLIEPPKEAFGIDVEEKILALEGIDTRLVADRKDRNKKDVEAMVTKAKADVVDPRIELLLGSPPVLENTTTCRNIAKFLKEAAMPSKNTGKRGR